ncbi:MAG: DUF4421 family protein [Bacteroidetes bacterium]|nr:DUF4421 family protein [Bacteroidota bacterium]
MILFLAPMFLFGQKKEKNGKEQEVKFDTSFIKSFHHDITLKCYGNFKSNNITETDGKNKTLDYTINNPFKIGFGVSYKWFNLLATVITPFPVNEYKKGKTNHFDLRVNMYGRSTVTDIWFQFYNGYYLANSNVTIPNWNNPNAYYRRPDIKVASLGGVMYFNRNKKEFSYKASFSQTDRQLKSAGAPILGVNWSAFGVRGDSALLPSALSKFTPEQRVQSITAITLGAGGGYAYTYVFKKHWFASLSATLFLVAQTYQYVLQGNPAPRVQPGLNINFLSRGAFGYNNDRNYYGVIFIADNIPLGRRLGSTFDYSFGTLNLMYARRFSLNK